MSRLRCLLVCAVVALVLIALVAPCEAKSEPRQRRAQGRRQASHPKSHERPVHNEEGPSYYQPSYNPQPSTPGHQAGGGSGYDYSQYYPGGQGEGGQADQSGGASTVRAGAKGSSDNIRASGKMAKSFIPNVAVDTSALSQRTPRRRDGRMVTARVSDLIEDGQEQQAKPKRGKKGEIKPLRVEHHGGPAVKPEREEDTPAPAPEQPQQSHKSPQQPQVANSTSEDAAMKQADVREVQENEQANKQEEKDQPSPADTTTAAETDEQPGQEQQQGQGQEQGQQGQQGEGESLASAREQKRQRASANAEKRNQRAAKSIARQQKAQQKAQERRVDTQPAGDEEHDGADAKKADPSQEEEEDSYSIAAAQEPQPTVPALSTALAAEMAGGAPGNAAATGGGFSMGKAVLLLLLGSVIGASLYVVYWRRKHNTEYTLIGANSSTF